MTFYFLDGYGWPVERIRGKWFKNFLRLLIHTRRVTTQRPRCLDPRQGSQGNGAFQESGK